MTRHHGTQGSLGVIAILIALGGAMTGPAMARAARIPPAGAAPVSVGSWFDPSFTESVDLRASRPRAVTIDPTDSPGPRSGHSAILDTLRRQMLVFGGSDGSSVFGDLWVYPLDGDTAWQHLPSGPTPAPQRFLHTAILDPVRDRLLVFGGRDSVESKNDVWVYPLSGGGTWSPLSVAGTPPDARYRPCGIYDPIRDRLIVFGGYANAEFRNDVWALSLSGTPTWTRLEPSGVPPAPGTETSAVYDPVRDRMILAGGRAPGYRGGDAWALSLGEQPVWTLLEPFDPGVVGRGGQTTVYDPARDAIWMFGGGAIDSFQSDVLKLSLSGDFAWSRPAMPGEVPPRADHSAILDPRADQMIVFGGYGMGARWGDGWALHLSSGIWSPLPGTPPAPPAPQFLAYIENFSILLGQTLEILVGGRNWGGPSDDGRISVSFPAFTDPADTQWVESSTSFDPSALSVVPAGTPIASSTCQPLTASCLAVEYRDDDWRLEEEGDLILRVRPQVVGTFYVNLRVTMHVPFAACTYITRPSSYSTVDQQGFHVVRYPIQVLSPPTPTLVSFGGAEVSPERVRLIWQVADGNGIVADVERSPGPPGAWEVLGRASGEGDRLVFEDQEVIPGVRYGYRLVERSPSRGPILDEQWVTVPRRAILALAGASPNPAPDRLWVAFSLPAADRATLELFDLRGRMLEQREVGSLGPGDHRVALCESRRLPTGVYLVRLVQGDRALTAKACVMR